MIENASIIRIDPPGAPSTGGDLTWTTGPAVNIRCCVQPLSMSLKRIVDAMKVTADTTLFVEIPPWPTAPNTVVSTRIVVQPDPVEGQAMPADSYLVQVVDLLTGGLSATRFVLKSE